jgi:hypothetical protein
MAQVGRADRAAAARRALPGTDKNPGKNPEQQPPSLITHFCCRLSTSLYLSENRQSLLFSLGTKGGPSNNKKLFDFKNNYYY